MAQLEHTTDKNNASEGFDVLPAGEYLAIIESSDYVENKKGTGKMLKLTYQIIDGHYKGSKLFNNLNLEHQNKQAEQIAKKSLNAIGVACGVDVIKDSAQLHGIPMKLDVKVRDSEQYGKQNNINKHLPAKDVQPPAQNTGSEDAGTGGKPKQAWED